MRTGVKDLVTWAAPPPYHENVRLISGLWGTSEEFFRGLSAAMGLLPASHGPTLMDTPDLILR